MTANSDASHGDDSGSEFDSESSCSDRDPADTDLESEQVEIDVVGVKLESLYDENCDYDFLFAPHKE